MSPSPGRKPAEESVHPHRVARIFRSGFPEVRRQARATAAATAARAGDENPP